MPLIIASLTVTIYLFIQKYLRKKQYSNQFYPNMIMSIASISFSWENIEVAAIENGQIFLGVLSHQVKRLHEMLSKESCVFFV